MITIMLVQVFYLLIIDDHIIYVFCQLGGDDGVGVVSSTSFGEPGPHRASMTIASKSPSCLCCQHTLQQATTAGCCRPKLGGAETWPLLLLRESLPRVVVRSLAVVPSTFAEAPSA
jgi:hypothetical protein